MIIDVHISAGRERHHTMTATYWGPPPHQIYSAHVSNSKSYSRSSWDKPAAHDRSRVQESLYEYEYGEVCIHTVAAGILPSS